MVMASSQGHALFPLHREERTGTVGACSPGATKPADCWEVVGSPLLPKSPSGDIYCVSSVTLISVLCLSQLPFSSFDG